MVLPDPLYPGSPASELDAGLRTGDYDLAAIERQLSRTGTPPL